MKNYHIRLCIIAFLFMLIFQMEARLLTYVYLFHEGLLLIQGMLLGGGLLLLAQEIIPEKRRQFLSNYTPLIIFGLFLLQQFVFYYLNIFVVDFLALSILFAFIFKEVTELLTIKSNHFYTIELAGSFLAIVVYVLLVQQFLEEPILVAMTVLLFVYAVLYTPPVPYRKLYVGTALMLVLGYGVVLGQASIPSLLQCSEQGTSYGYKSACLDDISGLTPQASFSHLKGRSDVYIRADGHNLTFLEVKNNGYRVSAANQEQYRSEEWFDLLEMRIPKLAYEPESSVLSVGAGAGSYVQALQTYIESPTITAVEIDQTVADIYESNLFDDFLPPRDSYQIIYEEGRRHLTVSDNTYDVITVAIEGINSTLPKYTDERTGLLYTKEALATYISRLNKDGYLVLEQYYPQITGGDEMSVKFLRTLQTAADVSDDAFSNTIYLYTWAFHNQPSAQRFISAIYKPDGFSEEDITTIHAWIKRLQTVDLGGGENPHSITIIHEPSNALNPVVFDTYFDSAARAAAESLGNTEEISDEKPFRHLVTTLPLPPFSYALFAFMASVAVLMLKLVRRKCPDLQSSNILLSVGLGIVTFGLQYLLFYKTAAFLHTNLIFFSVFLLMPLFFGAVGGYVSTILPRRYDWALVLLIALPAYVLVTVDVFTQTKLFLWTMVAMLFVIAGVLFPRLLEVTNSQAEKRVVYALNVVAGGFAFMAMITLHATLGWTNAFIITTIGMIGSIYLLHRR